MKGKSVTHSSWRHSALGDTWVSEINPPSEKKLETFIYIDLESVSQGKLLSENLIRAQKAPSRAQRVVHRQDVLFQLVRPYQKNNFFFNKKSDRQYIASTGYALIRPKQNAKYLYYFLHTDVFVSAVESYCTGSNYPAITSEKLSHIPVDIPKDLADQQHIADILSTCDEVIEQTEKTIAKYRKIKEGMLQDLFTRGLDTNGKLRPKPEDAPELYKDSPLGKIPKEWDDPKTLGYPSVAIINPIAGQKKDYFVYIDLECVSDGKILFEKMIPRKDAPSRAQRTISDNDILFQLVRPYQKNNLLFKQKNNYQYIASTGYAQIRATCNTTFLFYYIHNELFLRKVLSLCTGTGYPAITPQNLSTILIPLPKGNEQKEIAQRLSSLDTKIFAEEQTLAKYHFIKQSLMKKLLTPSEGALEA